MNLLSWFEKGLTVEEYRGVMQVNREEMDSIYHQFQLDEEELNNLTYLKDKKLKVIVLTEDWCGDAMLNIPILLRIGEELKMDARFVLRDQNLELMDQYLTNGTSRSIPIFIFIDEQGNEVAVWGPRAIKVQHLVDELRSSLPDKESPDFKEKQREMILDLTTSYKEDQQLWREVSSSIIETLSK